MVDHAKNDQWRSFICMWQMLWPSVTLLSMLLIEAYSLTSWASSSNSSPLSLPTTSCMTSGTFFGFEAAFGNGPWTGLVDRARLFSCFASSLSSFQASCHMILCIYLSTQPLSLFFPSLPHFQGLFMLLSSILLLLFLGGLRFYLSLVLCVKFNELWIGE